MRKRRKFRNRETGAGIGKSFMDDTAPKLDFDKIWQVKSKCKEQNDERQSSEKLVQMHKGDSEEIRRGSRAAQQDQGWQQKLWKGNRMTGFQASLVTGSAGSAVVKNPPANTGDARDAGSIPWWGRSPGIGNGNPLQYSCLEDCMEPGGLQPMGSQRVAHKCTHTPSDTGAREERPGRCVKKPRPPQYLGVSL